MNKIALAILVAVVFASRAVHAGEGGDLDRIRRAMLAGEILPLSAVLERVEAEYPGDLIETELEYKKGGPVYEIKLLTRDGRLMKLHYDARDGRRLSAREKGR